MDILYTKGELLQIHTKNCEIFEGRFYSMTSDKTKISLYDVTELPQGEKNESVCHYYETDVRNIVKLQDPESLLKHLKIVQKDCEEIIKTSKKYIFINQVDNHFHEAIDDLKQYSYVGLSTDGAALGRKSKMPFLILTTPHQIYIFDTQKMQYHAFDAGLKNILESEVPKKIVHDCRKISDCLYHKHNVKLKSVFDTQVGDLIIRKNKYGSVPATVKSLAECYNAYLGLSINTVNEKLDILERPLSSALKDNLAKNIAFLHRLSEAIHDEMMLPFVRGVEYFVDNLRSCDDFKAWELSGKLTQNSEELKNVIQY